MSIIAQNWPLIVTGAFTASVAYFNLPSAWILPQVRATEQFLAGALVSKFDNNGLVQEMALPAKSLWNEKGAVIMAVRRPG